MASRTSFEKYSRFERENQYSANHWSQRRVKSLRVQQLATGQYAVLCAPRVPPIRRSHSLDLEKPKSLSRSGSAKLNNQINYYLPPLHLSRNLSTPSITGGTRGRPASASNDRARRGFKYWVDDHIKAPPAVNVTMGSKGSFLGIGIPRL